MADKVANYVLYTLNKYDETMETPTQMDKTMETPTNILLRILHKEVGAGASGIALPLMPPELSVSTSSNTCNHSVWLFKGLTRDEGRKAFRCGETTCIVSTSSDLESYSS